jgi:hypothetical protein
VRVIIFLRSTLETTRRFWVCCRRPFLYKIREELPVIRPQSRNSTLSNPVKH